MGAATGATSRLRLCFIGPARAVPLQRWAEWFAARGHEVTVITVEPETSHARSFRQVDVSAPGVLGKPGRIFSSVRMVAALRRLNPDLVHAHYLRGLAWGLPLVGGCPCVATPWGSDVLEEQGAFREWYSRPLTRAVLRRADVVTVHSAFLEARLRPLMPPGRTLMRIGWGVDLKRFRPGVDTRPVRERWTIGDSRRVIFSPRLAQPFYRHELVIRAMPAVKDKISDALLVVAGHSADPGYVASLRRLASELGVEAHVQFTGPLEYSDMPGWMNLAEVTVMVPPSDGMPSTLLEAMACGSIPVLSRLPQYAELIEHGKNGFFVDAEGGGLAEALLAALADRAPRDNMARLNRARVIEEADQDREMERMEEQYQRMAKRGRSGVAWSDAGSAAAAEECTVMLLTVGLTIGGTEGQLLDLASRFDRRRFSVVVCALKGEGPVAHAMRERGIRVVTLNGFGAWDVRVLYRLFRLVRQERPAILHAFLGLANLAASLVGRLLGIPVVIWSYRDVEIWKTRAHWLVDRAGARWAGAITCCSDAVRQFVLAHLDGDESKLLTIHNGIDLEAFRSPHVASRSELSLREGGLVVGTVSRLDEPKKGLTVLLHALADLAGRDGLPPWQCLLVGDGPARERLETLAAQLGLSERVVFAGVRHDVASVLAAMDLFVCPSLYEGFGIAIVEAMAAGRPVVASAVGGIPEIVVNQDTGLLVPPGNAAALADAMAALLTRPDRAQAMGLRGRERAREKFSIETAVLRHQQLYETLSLRHAGRSRTARGAEAHRS